MTGKGDGGGDDLGSGVPDGLLKTADWTAMEKGDAGSGVPDGLLKTADWSSMPKGKAAEAKPAPDADLERELDEAAAEQEAAGEPDPFASGVPDGLYKTADWTGEDFGSGVPDGLTQTADWTGRELSPGVPDGLDKTADWTDAPGGADAIQAARAKAALGPGGTEGGPPEELSDGVGELGTGTRMVRRKPEVGGGSSSAADPAPVASGPPVGLIVGIVLGALVILGVIVAAVVVLGGS